jgi:dimethylargininase
MIAITRDVAATINACELTHIEYRTIDVVMARVQHEEYRRMLASLGCQVVKLPADDRYPDCVFVEDTAIVLDDLAVITRPGAESRRGETRVIADALEPYRPLVHIEDPATIDGGDVLVLDDRIFVGLSERTNEAAIGQLRYHTRREVIPVNVHGALHLKTAVTRVAHDTLLINREWVDAAPFADWKLIDVEEPFAANALLIGDVVVYPSAFPKTLAKLVGLDVRTVDASELAKAEGGVTCCCLGVR